MRSVLRFLATAAAGLLALQLVLLALLVGAQAVPNGPIVAQLDRAVSTGDYGADYAPDGFGGTADRFTECVVLGYGVSSDDDPRSLWYRATGGPRLESCDAGAGQIRALAAGGSVVPPASYFRYWNGYAVITRPALALLGVPGLRLVVAALLATATATAYGVLARGVGRWAALALLVPLAGATNAMAMPSSAFSHGIALAAVAAGVAATAVLSRHGWRGAVVGAGLAAALFDFVDLLTVPPMSWSLCAAVAGAVVHAQGSRKGGARRRDTALTVLAAGVAWPVAYGATWVSRWVIAAALQGPGVFSRIADKSRERLGGDDAKVVHALGAPTRANLRMWLATTATARPLLVVAAVVVVVCLVATVRRSGWAGLGVAAALGAPALVVPAWYELLSNHSQIHAFFTYRSLAAATGVVVMAAVVAAGRPAVRPPGRAGRVPRRRVPALLPAALLPAAAPARAPAPAAAPSPPGAVASPAPS